MVMVMADLILGEAVNYSTRIRVTALKLLTNCQDTSIPVQHVPTTPPPRACKQHQLPSRRQQQLVGAAHILALISSRHSHHTHALFKYS